MHGPSGDQAESQTDAVTCTFWRYTILGLAYSFPLRGLPDGALFIPLVILRILPHILQLVNVGFLYERIVALIPLCIPRQIRER